MKITKEHVRDATGQQLAKLFEVSENTIAGWTNGLQGASWRFLKRAEEKGIPKETVIMGLDLRIELTKERTERRKEMDVFLSKPSLTLKDQNSSVSAQ
jgi:hypothetical protein